jgi:hypothetical protein
MNAATGGGEYTWDCTQWCYRTKNLNYTDRNEWGLNIVLFIYRIIISLVLYCVD